MHDLSISSLWTVAAVVFGFQLAALSWRISREVHMESQGERTWVTFADGIVLLSTLILVVGVFLAPILTDISAGNAARLFGLSLVLFASAPVVLAGHYNLFRQHQKAPRDHVTTQERWSLTVPALFSVGYGVAWGIL